MIFQSVENVEKFLGVIFVDEVSWVWWRRNHPTPPHPPSSILLSIFPYHPLERFHSRDKQPLLLTATNDDFCIWKIELNSQMFNLGHQYGRRSFVFGHKYACYDVTWIRSLRHGSHLIAPKQSNGGLNAICVRYLCTKPIGIKLQFYATITFCFSKPISMATCHVWVKTLCN